MAQGCLVVGNGQPWPKTCVDAEGVVLWGEVSLLSLALDLLGESLDIRDDCTVVE